MTWSRSRNRALKILAGVVLTAVSGAGLAAPAYATAPSSMTPDNSKSSLLSGDTPVQSIHIVPTAIYTKYSIENKKTVSTSYIDKSHVLAECSVGKTGQSCSITRSTSATRTISLSLGVSRSFVAEQLGFSSAATVATSVTCNSGKMTKGQVFRAYARGTRYSYKVLRVRTASIGFYLQMNESGTLYAFNPRKNAVHCV